MLLAEARSLNELVIELKLTEIELRFSVARIGSEVRSAFNIPSGIASNACFCCQLSTIDSLSFSTKLIAPVTSAAELTPGKEAVPIKLAIAEPLSTILISA